MVSLYIKKLFSSSIGLIFNNISNCNPEVSNNGFKDGNLISVNLFKYKNTFKCSLADDGNHRIRIAYIVGLKSIPLKVSKIIDFDDIENWMNVKNELYSLNDAKKIFIDYFNYSGKGAYV